ncbi:hypothetical protein FEM48_Zijuj03G0054300 [Ziziphus jujuba var. spinosa]|uniref:Uncharacterized protein n=1 Tax=Ziziphus jujuba var. spinosa TaxID=714518 RepID=A0A978VNF7_ZIZJJ|nr:hypothetical protein FEM48_Zijuj03G0054300 [Ziziphus jujuba var. spinosa]
MEMRFSPKDIYGINLGVFQGACLMSQESRLILCTGHSSHALSINHFDRGDQLFNPVLLGVPKGCYGGIPNGSCSIIRKLVQALHHIGLRVVLDFVYRHLHGSAPFDKNSVLNKIVPGYYLRTNTDGFIENGTCVNNTATGHFMVEHLIIDDLLHWTVDYKVDGFRFDLMGHIMKRAMIRNSDQVSMV